MYLFNQLITALLFFKTKNRVAAYYKNEKCIRVLAERQVKRRRKS